MAQPSQYEEKGIVFNIQKFSVNDGPGIRTTVFMKGCPLDCVWCSNPESKSFKPELMVRDINCKRCGACVEACPQGAISITQETGRVIHRDQCDQCLVCVDSCLYGALVRCGTNMTVKEVLDEVLQDRVFYKNSGGGITVSGGEPLSQSAFVGALLAACKDEGLHTALDTSGHAPWRNMEPVLAFVDLVLFDVKHLDSNEHRKATGVRNKTILENLKKAAKLKEVWFRVPLIPGYNDSGEHVKKIAVLGKEVGARKISLLPYHEGGRSKSTQLGIPYGFPERETPGETEVNHLKEMIEAMRLGVTVGM